MALERAPEWEDLSLNHLEGRTAAFFCYSDAGANEMDPSGRPKKLRHKEWFDPDAEPFEDERHAYRGLVWQCRYSGIEVPDELWSHALTGEGAPYSQNQAEDMVREDAFMAAFDAWSDRFAAFVGRKDKVEPGVYRAYGYTAPGHRWADLKLKWRELRMKAGAAPAGSSPREQQALGINRDTGLGATKSEGERLRE
jgi:hypothetical protein